MTAAKHTPGELVHGRGYLTSVDPYGRGPMHVAQVRGWGHLTGGGACDFTAGKAEEIQDANGDRLALAWNCHDELLAACQAAHTLLDDIDDNVGLAENVGDEAVYVFVALRTALAKAGAK